MRTLLTICLLAAACTASAAPRNEKISWTEGGKTFDGVLVWDDSGKALRPGLLMIPNWYGVNDKAIAKAQVLAGTDYVILLADMYGRGVRPADAEAAGKATGEVYKDPAVLRARAAKALATLRGAGKQAPIDANDIGAIGFCFGGAVALELARSGADLDGVTTFHANLATKSPATRGQLKSPVLVMNGADDTYVPAQQIEAFQAEMRAAEADWQFVNFGGAVHCFAEPDENAPGCKYHEPSYRRGVSRMREFFAEAFAGD